MIYLIGGPPRVGKTTLAKHLAAQLGIGWIGTDAIRDIVNRAIPDFGTMPCADITLLHSHAEKFYPYLEQIAWSCHDYATHYIIEGVEFLPTQAARLIQNTDWRCCFLGSQTLTVTTLTDHPGHTPWQLTEPAERLAALPGEVAAFSRLVQDECARYALPYVEVGVDHDEALQHAINALIQPTATA